MIVRTPGIGKDLPLRVKTFRIVKDLAPGDIYHPKTRHNLKFKFLVQTRICKFQFQSHLVESRAYPPPPSSPPNLKTSSGFEGEGGVVTPLPLPPLTPPPPPPPLPSLPPRNTHRTRRCRGACRVSSLEDQVLWTRCCCK